MDIYGEKLISDSSNSLNRQWVKALVPRLTVNRCSTVHVRTLYVGDTDPFHEPFAVRAVNLGLQHVRHVEQRTRPARVQVRRRYAVGVLDRQQVTGVRHHPAAVADVQIVQARFPHVARVRPSPCVTRGGRLYFFCKISIAAR